MKWQRVHTNEEGSTSFIRKYKDIGTVILKYNYTGMKVTATITQGEHIP